jgi:hypothetical protein
MLNFFVVDPGSGASLILDPGSGMEKFGSGINIPDPQHWFFVIERNYSVY